MDFKHSNVLISFTKDNQGTETVRMILIFFCCSVSVQKNVSFNLSKLLRVIMSWLSIFSH